MTFWSFAITAKNPAYPPSSTGQDCICKVLFSFLNVMLINCKSGIFLISIITYYLTDRILRMSVGLIALFLVKPTVNQLMVNPSSVRPFPKQFNFTLYFATQKGIKLTSILF